MSGSLETKYKWSEYGLTFTEKWNTDNTLGTEIAIEDQVIHFSWWQVELETRGCRCCDLEQQSTGGTRQAEHQLLCGGWGRNCWRPISAPISSPSMLFDPLFLQHIGNLMNEWGWKQKYLLAWEFTHLENCRVPVWTFAWHNSQAMLNILRKKEFFNNKREGTLSPCPSSSYFCLFTCDIGQEQKCSTPHLPPKLWLEY